MGDTSQYWKPQDDLPADYPGDLVKLMAATIWIRVKYWDGEDINGFPFMDMLRKYLLANKGIAYTLKYGRPSQINKDPSPAAREQLTKIKGMYFGIRLEYDLQDQDRYLLRNIPHLLQYLEANPDVARMVRYQPKKKSK